MQQTHGACPECGHKFFSYEPAQRFYGSPIRTCKKCGQKYFDARYHEIAIEGIAKKDVAKWPAFVLMFFGAFLMYRGNHLWGMKQLGTLDFMQKVLPVLLLAVGGLLVLGGIYELYAVLSGKKAANMEKLRAASEERLKNPGYAQELKAMGLPVPEQYLDGGFEQ